MSNGEFRISAGGLSAIANGFGWHIRMPSRPRRPGGPLEVCWIAVDTRAEAVQVLMNLLTGRDAWSGLTRVENKRLLKDLMRAGLW